jgi:maltose alpha-D-glucosyltransferase/alpha-amylase
MQWTSGRNGGFSGADPTDLYLPLLTDPVHGHKAANVDAERRDSSSMLHWMRRTLAIRREHPVFGTGGFSVIQASNASVLAFVRQHGDDVVLCINNLSRFAQPTSLPLQRFEGRTPIEMRGRVPFPPIEETDYFVTLGPYGTYWLELLAHDER